jgi:very-short-patch-repair endonuclease
MEYLVPGIAVLIILAAVVYFTAAKPKQTTASTNYPYQKREYLLSKAERLFYDTLIKSVGPEIVVFTKVRLADLVQVERGTASWQSYQNKINAKHLDFVLCTKSTLSPTLAVELDDASHDREDRSDRDTFVDNVLRSAKLPVLRVRAKSSYSSEEVMQQVKQSLLSK